MCTRNELDMILRKIAEVYRSVYGDELVSIFLYGSYARGDINQIPILMWQRSCAETVVPFRTG